MEANMIVPVSIIESIKLIEENAKALKQIENYSALLVGVRDLTQTLHKLEIELKRLKKDEKDHKQLFRKSVSFNPE